VPANVPLTLVLDNRDAGVPHGFQLSDANGNVIAKSEIIEGPAQRQVALPALVPGAHPFICPVHPNMTGMITAQP
jgi:plastocyanin